MAVDYSHYYSFYNRNLLTSNKNKIIEIEQCKIYDQNHNNTNHSL